MLTFVRTNYRNIVAQMAITICDIWPKTTLVTNCKFCSQYFLAHFLSREFRNFHLSAAQQMFWSGRVCVGKSMFTTRRAVWTFVGPGKYINCTVEKHQQSANRNISGEQRQNIEMCPRSGERNNTERQDLEIKAKWTKQKVEQQETLGKHAFISSNLQQGKVWTQGGENQNEDKDEEVHWRDTNSLLGYRSRRKGGGGGEGGGGQREFNYVSHFTFRRPAPSTNNTAQVF